jgi:uncharacterized protein YecT (DUF1311 family)
VKNSFEKGILSMFRKLSAFLFVVVCATSASAGDNFSVEKFAGERIEGMTESYALIDVRLNEQYQRMIKNRGFADKKLLVEGERLWIKYRDAGCKEMADEYGPGNIHDLAKLRCLASATSSRLTELVFIETGVVGDQFDRVLPVIAEATSKSVDQIIARVGLVKLTPEIEEYFSKNCELTFSRFKESREHCYARLIFKDA